MPRIIFAPTVKAEYMKISLRLRRFSGAAALLLCALLFAVYLSPSMRHSRALPDSVCTFDIETDALAGVSGSYDERLIEASGQREYTIKLFGFLPVRTVETVGELNEVALGGCAVGVMLFTEGVQVVGTGTVLTEDGRYSPASQAGLAAGDVILSVNGSAVSDAAQFSALCAKDAELSMSCLRAGEGFNVTMRPVQELTSGEYRIGLWVRDSTSGMGTLSFYDPDTRAYAALGHSVSDVDTGLTLRLGDGYISFATVTGVQKGASGTPGELYGQFSKSRADAVAAIDLNTEFGIAGRLNELPTGAVMVVELAKASQVRLGDAVLIATIEGTTPAAYSCEVIRADVQNSPTTQGLMIRVTDETLLELTGGIVQGMSGSPVLQDGRLIAVVTHVFVNEPERGFCVYAEWMYERLLKPSA